MKKRYKKKWLIDEYCRVTNRTPNRYLWSAPDRELAEQAGLATGSETKNDLREKLNAAFLASPSRHAYPSKKNRPRREWTPRPGSVDPATDAFLDSYEWRRVRITVLKKYGARCQCCGASPADGLKMHVDHIKPRKIYPQLALDVDNLQVLCEVCNHGKGNWDMTDWRPAVVEEEVDEAVAHLRSIAKENSER